MKTAYINGIILNGHEDMAPTPGLAVLVDGETIAGVVPAGEVPAEYTAVDLRGGYLMPGLINLHVHIPGSGKPAKKQADTKKLVKLITSNGLMRKIGMNLCASYARTELMSGVTTIRSVGGIQDFDSRLRDQINQEKVVGPRILAGNMAISVPGGHMAGSLAYEVHSSEEAAGFVRKIAQDKPDLIKLMITGGVLDAEKKGEPGILRMAPELVKAACNEARRLGLPVAAHVESPQGVQIALENGVNTIEHGAKPTEEILRLFRERGSTLVTTLSPAIPYALFNPAISHCDEMGQYNGKIVFEGIVECAKACLAAGISVGLGTDTGCPFVTHYDMWRELHYFCKFCDVTPAFALSTATKGNAKIAGLGDKLGTIEAGKCADMIVCAKNPLESLDALRQLDIVITRGQRIDEPKVKKIEQVERELDRFL